MLATRLEIMRLRRLGSLNYRRSERLKEARDPRAIIYRAASNAFYSDAAAIIMRGSL